MPNILKRRKLQRPKYSIAKQIDVLHIEETDEEVSPEDGTKGTDPKVDSQEQPRYPPNDYMANLEGLSLSMEENKEPKILSMKGGDDFTKSPGIDPNDEAALDLILADLQSALPSTTESPIPKSPPNQRKPQVSVYDESKSTENAQELSAVLEEIVSNMDAFVLDPYETLPCDMQPIQSEGQAHLENDNFDDSDEGYATGRMEDSRKNDPVYAVSQKRKFESTPNLYKVQHHDPDYTNYFGYNSLKKEKSSNFEAVAPEKKSVSFNDVVFEMRSQYRNSDVSVDTDTVTDVKAPINDYVSADETARLLEAGERENTTPSAHDDAEVKAIYESQNSLDDVISMPSEDDLYTSGNETETEDEREEIKIEPFISKKVRKLRKSRTALLIIAWFTMGLVTLLPSSSLDDVGTTFAELWTPTPPNLLAKGTGFFLGVFLGGLSSKIFPRSHELSVAMAMLMLAGGVAVRAWCVNALMMCASHAVEGTGRGIASIASHLYLQRLWHGDTVFLVLHCLFIAFAAGSSAIPAITFTLSVNAKHMLHALPFHVDHFLLHENGHTPLHNASDPFQAEYEYNQDQTTAEPVDQDAAEGHIILSLLQASVSVIPLMVALVLTSFTLYTSISNCRNKIRYYRYKKNIKRTKTLKDKLSSSLGHAKVFPNLNGNPGDNSPTQDQDKQSKKDSVPNVIAPSSADPEKDSDTKRQGSSVKDEGNADKTNAKQPNGHINHVTHITQSKQRKISFKLPDTPANKNKSKHSETWLMNNKSCGIGTLLYLYVFFSLAAAMEYILCYFIYIYAIYCPLQLSQSRAVLLLTLFLLSIVLSRVIVLPVSVLMPPNAIVMGCLALSIMSSTILVVYGGDFKTIMWIFTALLGACIGPIVPAGFTWANIYLNFNWKSLSLAYWLMALGMALFSSLAAALFQYRGCRAVMWLVVALAIFSFVLFLPTMPSIKARKVLRLTSRKKADNVIDNSKRTYL